MRRLIAGIVLVILVAVGFFAWQRAGTRSLPPDAADAVAESYVRDHIAELSPEPAVLGGTFYVTEIAAESGQGSVSYEDGHIAFDATFTYVVDATGSTTITSFVIR